MRAALSVVVFRRRRRKVDEAEKARRQAAVVEARSYFDGLLDESGVLSLEKLGELFTYVTEQKDFRSEIWGEVLVPMYLALAQGGQFIRADNTSLLLQDDEKALYDCPAYLLKETMEREMRGASQGISVPLGGGVRYRVGAVRGQMVTIGSHWTTADEGALTLTTRRLVYHGRRQTLAFPLDKLAGLNVYGDAIAVGATNRKSNSHFRVGTPELVAGLIQGAVSHREHVVVINLQFEEATSLADQRFEIVKASGSD